ncbi:hypothetical protein KKC97_10425 [bacterium]|nr:hypothetical protein [bacterium]MBU1638066.1 hypothetical protein [bacterium]MBU1920400.1 hypothetical protein [bacterium]
MFTHMTHRTINKTELFRAFLLVAFAVPLLLSEIAALGHSCKHASPLEHSKCSLCVLALSVAVNTPETVIDKPTLSPERPVLIPESVSAFSLPRPSAPRAPPALLS